MDMPEMVYYRMIDSSKETLAGSRCCKGAIINYREGVGVGVGSGGLQARFIPTGFHPLTEVGDTIILTRYFFPGGGGGGGGHTQCFATVFFPWHSPPHN